MPSQEHDLSQYMSEVTTRVDSHYADGTVSLGTILELFGMAGGLLSYKFDGDAGVICAFEKLEFLKPAFHGDYLRVTAKLLSVGNTSRKRQYDAYAIARCHGVGQSPTAGDMLAEPIHIATAIGTVVVRKELQRSTPNAFVRGKK